MHPSRSFPHLFLLAATVGLGLGGARTSRACSLAPCPLPIDPLDAGAMVPANVPAFRVGGLITTSVVDIELVTGAGDKVETKIERGDFFAQLVPLQPLLPDRPYRLSYREACSSPAAPSLPDGGVRNQLHEIPFSTISAATLPSAIGDVTLAPVQFANDPLAFTGKIVIGEVLVVPSAGLAPFLPVTSFEIRLNDRAIATSATRPGAVGTAGARLEVRAACNDAILTCGDYAALGSYTATVAATVPGLPQAVVSTPFTLDLTCAGLDGGSEGAPDAAPPIDATPSIDVTAPPLPPAETDASVEAGPPATQDAATNAASPAKTDAGCACSLRSAATPPRWWSLVAVALGARIARRRARS